MNQPLPVRVICFGDSLTAGFQSPTRENPQGRRTPYGDWVQEMIGAAGEVRTSGICGELTGEMLARFRRDVLAHQPHYVVILGGTNDLGWNGSPGEIMRNLAKMYEQTLAAGGVPVPVTVPSLRVEDATGSREGQEWVADHPARRFELNTLIGEYARTKGLPAIDLFAATDRIRHESARPRIFQRRSAPQHGGVSSLCRSRLSAGLAACAIQQIVQRTRRTAARARPCHRWCLPR